VKRRPVDLGAVRAGRARLAALVREHPELVGRGGGGVQGWVTTLERDEAMAETEQVAFRLPADLVKKLDDYAARLAREQPGMTFTRTDVVRMLLTRGLEADSRSKGKPKAGRGGAAK
jgi:hypothetical protein